MKEKWAVAFGPLTAEHGLSSISTTKGPDETCYPTGLLCLECVSTHFVFPLCEDSSKIIYWWWCVVRLCQRFGFWSCFPEDLHCKGVSKSCFPPVREQSNTLWAVCEGVWDGRCKHPSEMWVPLISHRHLFSPVEGTLSSTFSYFNKHGYFHLPGSIWESWHQSQTYPSSLPRLLGWPAAWADSQDKW